MSEHVLVVEDDPVQSGLLAAALRRGGYDVSRALDAAEATRLAAAAPDLVVLDLGLPDGSGLDLLAELTDSRTPVIIVSGRGDVVDRVIGIEMGADDYLVKPVEPRELLARIRRRLARPVASSPSDAGSDDDVIAFGDVVIDGASHEVSVAGAPLDLSRREFDLLLHLARHPRRVFSRSQLLRDVWHRPADGSPGATVTEHVRRLRSKLRHATSVRLDTVRGVGYRLSPIATTDEDLP